MSLSSFSFPTAIQFGPGARKEVAAHLREQGLERPLIVTDKALAALPVLTEFRTHLAGLDVAVYSGVAGNPTGSQVMAGARWLRKLRRCSSHLERIQLQLAEPTLILVR